MMRAPATNWLMGWLLITGIFIVLYPPLALAIGDDITLGGLSCAGGTATGQLSLLSGSCPTTLGFDNIFSFLVCNMQQLASNILGHMYCGLIFNLEPYVWGMLTIAVVFFGVSFTIGLTAATGAEAIAFLLKIAFVVAFATNADFLIGVAYRLLITGLTDGVTIILNGMGITGATTGAEAFQLLDNFLEQILGYAIGGTGSGVGTQQCQNAIFAVIATMSLAFPMVAYFALALIAKILFSFFRAIFGYIYAIFGVTFLIILAPIFVCFYLFKPTQEIFNKWLGYMISMVVQVVMLFAFLTFILSLNVSSMTSNLSDLIMYQSQAPETTAFRLPWRYCTLCDFRIVDRANNARIMTDRDDDFIRQAQLLCNITTPTNVPNATGALPNPNAPATDNLGRTPITVTVAVSPDQLNGQMGALLTLLGNGILSLIVLAVVIERLLAMLPQLAQRLGSTMGASYVPQMGGGGYGETLVVPGERRARDFSEGFSRSTADSGGDALTGSVQGVRDGIEAMLTGKYKDKSIYGYDLSTKEGIQAHSSRSFSWDQWISNPRDFGK